MLNLIRYARLWLKTVITDEKGQGMVEYGLIIAGVALIAVAGFAIFGDDIREWIEGLGSELDVTPPGSGS